MDGRAIFPEGWHPQRFLSLPNGDWLPDINSFSRTAAGPVRYYFIDFGLSTIHQDRTTGIHGQERAPELSETETYDPYKLDVYVLGKTYFNLIVNVSRCV